MTQPFHDFRPLPVPEQAAWSRIGLRLESEIHAGHQSRVFRASRGTIPLVAKLTDGRLVDAAHPERIEVLARLAQVNEDVVGPVQVGDSLLTELGGWMVVCYPFVEGIAPDIGRRDHVAAMATALAKLHTSLGAIGDSSLPPVAALRQTDTGLLGRRQLIHGDFSNANLLLLDGEVKVLDFDDCGYGSVEFDVGNTLYMVMFDAFISKNPERYERFRTGFVDSYRASASVTLGDESLDAAIERRIGALRRWLDDLGQAPIGVRTASNEWRRQLRAFLNAI